MAVFLTGKRDVIITYLPVSLISSAYLVWLTQTGSVARRMPGQGQRSDSQCNSSQANATVSCIQCSSHPVQQSVPLLNKWQAVFDIFLAIRGNMGNRLVRPSKVFALRVWDTTEQPRLWLTCSPESEAANNFSWCGRSSSLILLTFLVRNRLVLPTCGGDYPPWHRPCKKN